MTDSAYGLALPTRITGRSTDSPDRVAQTQKTDRLTETDSPNAESAANAPRAGGQNESIELSDRAADAIADLVLLDASLRGVS